MGLILHSMEVRWHSGRTPACLAEGGGFESGWCQSDHQVETPRIVDVLIFFSLCFLLVCHWRSIDTKLQLREFSSSGFTRESVCFFSHIPGEYYYDIQISSSTNTTNNSGPQPFLYQGLIGRYQPYHDIRLLELFWCLRLLQTKTTIVRCTLSLPPLLHHL